MESFIIAFLQRVLSGAQNGFGYAKNIIGLWALAIILMLYPWCCNRPHWLFLLFYVINIFVIIMKTISFDRGVFKFLDKIKDIHLWEEFTTSGFWIWLILAGHNIPMLCFSVYPAMILHKGFINIGSGLKFFDSKTDDPTGKTYGIPLLGIKIRRSSTTMRLIFAGLSLIAAGLCWHFGWLEGWHLPIKWLSAPSPL